MSIQIPTDGVEVEDATLRAELPDALPVLPLRETVPFPNTLTPLADPDSRTRNVPIQRGGAAEIEEP